MRLESIQATKRRVGCAIPVCSLDDVSDRINMQFRLMRHEPVRRRLARALATSALGIRRHSIEKQLGFALSFQPDALSLGERFGDDASIAVLLRATKTRRVERVLIPGCYLGGEDVQFWLRRGVKRLDGVDLNSLAKRWETIVPHLAGQYGAEVRFQQAPLEKLPFLDESFDLIATSAVLEHVQNIDAVSAETARVLKPGGLAWHGFGPLYFSFGADHCIAAYGDDCGYDHLLLSEQAYQARINDQSFYDRQADPNLPFWARHDQFSFASAREYLRAFGEFFHIRHLVAKISEPGLLFRKRLPDKWNTMLAAGIAEENLLIKGLTVVLEKK